MWCVFFLLIVQSQAIGSMTNTMKQRLVEKPKKDNSKNFIWNTRDHAIQSMVDEIFSLKDDPHFVN